MTPNDLEELAVRLGAATSALERIAHLRPFGDIDTARNTRKLVMQMETIALQALARAKAQSPNEEQNNA